MIALDVILPKAFPSLLVLLGAGCSAVAPVPSLRIHPSRSSKLALSPEKEEITSKSQIVSRGGKNETRE